MSYFNLTLALSDFQHHYQVLLNKSSIGDAWQTLKIKDDQYLFQQKLQMKLLWKTINIVETSEGEIKNNLLKPTRYSKNENGKIKVISDFSQATYDQLACQLALQQALENKVPQRFVCRYTNGKKVKDRHFLLQQKNQQIIASDSRYIFTFDTSPLQLTQINDQHANFGQLKLQLLEEKK